MHVKLDQNVISVVSVLSERTYVVMSLVKFTVDSCAVFVNCAEVSSLSTTITIKLRLIRKVLKTSFVHLTSPICCLLLARGQHTQRRKCTEQSTRTLARETQSPSRCVTTKADDRQMIKLADSVTRFYLPIFWAKLEPSSTAEFIVDKIGQFYRLCVIQKISQFFVIR